MPKGFALELWRQAMPQFHRVLHSRFIRELIGGTLPRSHFLSFLADDCYYLKKCSPAMNRIHDKAEHLSHRLALKKIQEGTEREAAYVQALLTSERYPHVVLKPDASPKGIAWANYINLISQTAEYGAVYEGACVIGPCLWFYQGLGNHFKLMPIADEHPYQVWIAQLTVNQSVQPLSEHVANTIEIINFYAERVDETEREKMRILFLRSAAYEAEVFERAAPAVVSKIGFWRKRDERSGTARQLLDAARYHPCSPS